MIRYTPTDVEVRVICDFESERFERAIENGRYRPARDALLFYLIIYAGLKLSEARKLKVSDIDFESKKIRIDRSIPLSEPLQKKLKKIFGCFWYQEHDLVLWAGKNRRKTMPHITACKIIQSHLEHLGYHFRATSMRYWYLKMILRQTGDLEYASELGGYANPEAARKIPY